MDNGHKNLEDVPSTIYKVQFIWMQMCCPQTNRFKITVNSNLATRKDLSLIGAKITVYSTKVDVWHGIIAFSFIVVSSKVVMLFFNGND